MSLMRNFELSWNNSERPNFVEGSEALGLHSEERKLASGEAHVNDILDCADQISSQCLKDLSPEALSYIQQLEAELCSAQKELDAQKQDYTQMESNKDNNNNLLEYLRSLASEMVIELSQPSSVEVKEVIHELVQNTIQRFVKDDVTSEVIRNTSIESVMGHEAGGSESSEMFTTSRDYLAKLLFWCMLLGHHLRGLENRLHLSCAVGLL